MLLTIDGWCFVGFLALELKCWEEELEASATFLEGFCIFIDIACSFCKIF